MRAHIILPEELVGEVDRLAGKRGRSRFIEEAVQERVRREKLRAALHSTAGILKAEDYPEWSIPAKISEWVRRSRELDNKRLEEKLRRWHSE